MAETRPNIITILVDDMGFSDPGCFGGEIETPNLDRLATNGFRASQFYNTPRCCPSRACLLTGLYPHEAGVGMMVYRDIGEGYEGGLNKKCVTIAEVLRSADYQTMLSGKWHVGHEPAFRPEERGFDKFTGIYTHVDSYWRVLPGCEIYRDGEIFIGSEETPRDPYAPDEEFHTTDFFTNVALDYIDQASQDAERPFYLHLCYNAPHFPLEAPDDLIEKYRGRYAAGWDQLREDKLARMKEMGILPSSQKLPETSGFDQDERDGFDFKVSVDSGHLPAWDSLSDSEQAELDFRRAIYAAQVEHMDRNIGRLLEDLFGRGILDNTMIVFMSDNGCSGELGPYGMNWPEYNSANYKDWRTEGGWATAQGQCWASLSNTPLRKYKIFVHEGGIASPFIVNWPSEIAEPGGICSEQVFHMIDILPTICEVAGVEIPTEFAGRRITPGQGVSLLPWLRGTADSPIPRTLYWQHEINAAIREDNWKLVTSDDRDPNAWELYDLSRDRSESEDLRERYPEKAAELEAKWRKWAKKSNVIPYPESRDCLRRIQWPPR
jgi:arylsulfatase A-like enzyme